MNRLGSATSPYLLQHADNPVDWFPWGDEAFAEARRRDVPVLLSVGYAACHWCHVMAHESFEDDAIAARMNDGFVNVKVDREERPDVDAVYMAATQALTGQGGWPMTVFLTPDGRPFYAGTYFPTRPSHGLPSFGQLLEAIGDTWRERRGDVDDAAGRIREALTDAPLPGAGVAPDPATLQRVTRDAVRRLLEDEDPQYGGFGTGTKFPPSATLEFLVRHAAARPGDDDGAGGLATRTLAAMALGGLYDQLAGGFARYTVDRAWVVPHFEKMLYDNAQLARVYLHHWRLTGDPQSRRVAEETCAWMLADLLTPEGGLASSLDADTDGVEGLTYVWTPAELDGVLGETDGRWAALLLGVTDAGTFEHGSSTLQLDTGILADAASAERWAGVRARLLEARSRRPQPGRDDKVVAAWNGLAIAALAETGALLERPEFVAAAERIADLLLAVHLVADERGHPRLRRVSRAGVAGAPSGVLEDYADVAEGLLALFAVTGESTWLEVAGDLLDTVLARFGDGAGGFYDTAEDDTDPALAAVRRPREPTEGPHPSGWTAAAGALLSYAALTGSSRHREAAEQALSLVALAGPRVPVAVGWGLAVAEALIDGPREIAVVGQDGEQRRALHRIALRATAPGAVVAVGDPDAEGVPLLAGRGEAAARVFVCRNFTCDLPVSDPGQAAGLVGARDAGGDG